MDCRGFKSITPTKFCSIRFSEVFLTSEINSVVQKNTLDWLKQLEQIFYHHNRFESVVIRDATDCRMINDLMSNIIIEHSRKELYFEQNTQHYITLILNILSRNVVNKPTKKFTQNDEPLINKMLTYIKQHIGNTEQLKVKNLSRTFNISQNYLGEYFKKLTGESLQQYILVYKIKCVEQRLLYSDYTISQISDELGFTDESHLSRQFKKHNGVSPNKYKQENISSR